ncbi:hypothetical protein AAY473_037387 [Plecturocebus cupreus]
MLELALVGKSTTTRLSLITPSASVVPKERKCQSSHHLCQPRLGGNREAATSGSLLAISEGLTLLAALDTARCAYEREEMGHAKSRGARALRITQRTVYLTTHTVSRTAVERVQVREEREAARMVPGLHHWVGEERSQLELGTR